MGKRKSGSWSGREVTRARDFWRPRVMAGGMFCWRCKKPIRPGDTWTVGHLVDRADGGAKTRNNEWPEHPKCNYSAGGKRGAQLTNSRRPVVVARRTREKDRGIRGW